MQKYSIFAASLILLAELISPFTHGFPVTTTVDAPPQVDSAVPEFLMDVHECWSSLESDQNKASCLPIKTEQDFNDVNTVRAIKGTVSLTSSEGFYSNRSPLPSSLTYTFKMHPQRTSEEFRYAYIQISKLPITDEDLEHINNRCSGPVSLQLLSKLSSSNDSLFTPLSSATLNTSDFGRSLEVKFSGITGQFIKLQNHKMEMRLVISGADSCYSSYTPQDFGFTTSHSDANIVILAKSNKTEGERFGTEFPGVSSMARGKRSTGTAQNSGFDYFNLSSDHNLHHCRLYSINMSLELLGIRVEDGLISDPIYQANICAGSCDFPPGGDTNHSFILGSASRLCDDCLPPPCCVPNRLLPHSVIFHQNSDVFVTYRWDDMIAVSCGCR